MRAAQDGEAGIFLRWVMLVYLPLALLAAGIVLLVGQVLPGWGLPILIGIAAWSALAVRLLVERRRRGVEVRVPRNLLVGVAALGIVAAAGFGLAWAGIGRLDTGSGPFLVLIGGFLLLVALIAPMLKLIEVAFRRGAGLILSLLGRRRR
ncbi:MAG: hypothetical protein ACRDJ4_05810 [Actinomycetota bacterium]